MIFGSFRKASEVEIDHLEDDRRYPPRTCFRRSVNELIKSYLQQLKRAVCEFSDGTVKDGNLIFSELWLTDGLFSGCAIIN